MADRLRVISEERASVSFNVAHKTNNPVTRLSPISSVKRARKYGIYTPRSEQSRMRILPPRTGWAQWSRNSRPLPAS